MKNSVPVSDSDHCMVIMNMTMRKVRCDNIATVTSCSSLPPIVVILANLTPRHGVFSDKVMCKFIVKQVRCGRTHVA